MSETHLPPVTDADYTARIAALLGDPLPADWQNKLAIEARQDHLAALAHGAGESAITALAHLADLRQQGVTPTPDEPVLRPFTIEMAALYFAMLDYTRQTQRGDALEIVHSAVEFSAGATIAALVVGLIERARECESARKLGG